MKLLPLVSLILAAPVALFLGAASPLAAAAPAANLALGDPPPVEHRWEVTESADPGSYPFGGSSDEPGWLWKGKITPPLPPGGGGIPGGIVCTVPSDSAGITVAGCVGGSADGSGWTLWIKKTCVAGCKQVKVTFTDVGGNSIGCVTVILPKYSVSARLESVYGGLTTGANLPVDIWVTDRTGAVNTAYDGYVTVIPGSILGSGILINGSSGTTQIQITKGVGSMVVRTVNGIPGDTLTFDIFDGSRLSLRRSSLNVW